MGNWGYDLVELWGPPCTDWVALKETTHLAPGHSSRDQTWSPDPLEVTNNPCKGL